MARLDGKIAIVTGGTRGIGRSIAERFLSEGARVAVIGRQARNGDDASDDKLLHHGADVSEADAVVTMVARVVAHFGAIDILVNNAGIEIEKSLEDMTEAEWDRLMAVNVKSLFLCCRAVIPHLRQRGGGVIINMGSTSGIAADGGMPAYNTTKAAVHGLTRSIAIDHGKDGIRCNAICPGWIETDMLDQTLAREPDIAQAKRRAIGRHPVGRLGQPTDVAGLAAWLASDESAFASGQLFVLDGGLTAGSPIGVG